MKLYCIYLRLRYNIVPADNLNTNSIIKRIELSFELRIEILYIYTGFFVYAILFILELRANIIMPVWSLAD